MRTWTLIAGALTVAGAMVVGVAATAQQTAPDRPGASAGKQRTIERKSEPDVLVRRLAVLGDRDVQIGATIRDLDEDRPDSRVVAGSQSATMTGAVVEAVREDSPAQKAGLESGDVVTEFDGERVRSARHLSRLVEETAPGRTVKATVVRGGKRVDVQITPERGAMAWAEGALPDMAFEGRFPHPWVRPDLVPRGDREGRRSFPGPEDFEFFVRPSGRGRLGIGVQDLTPQLADYFGTKDGVLVTSVTADSPAAKAGLKAGDVITAVGDTPVKSPDDLIDRVRRADDGSTLRLSYTRDKKGATATVTLEPSERPNRPSRPV